MRTKTLREIDISRNESLEELCWESGEVIGLNCGIDLMTGINKFILTVPQGIIKGYSYSGLNVCNFREHNIIKYSIIPKNNIVIFLYPAQEKLGFLYGILTPNYEYENIKKCTQAKSYSFEKAYSGRKVIQDALDKSEDLYLYGQYLRDGRLIVERSRIGSIMEKLGLGFLLQEQLRIRRF